MFARRWFSQTMALLVVLIGMVGVAGAQKADPNDPHLSSLPPDLRKEYVVTPGGLLMHRSCVHQVENGETVNFVDGSIKGTDGQVRNTALCKYPSFDYSGVERPGLPSPPPPDEGTRSKRNQ